MNDQLVTFTPGVPDRRERIAARRASLKERVANLAVMLDAGVVAADELTLQRLAVECACLSLHPETARVLRWLGYRG